MKARGAWLGHAAMALLLAVVMGGCAARELQPGERLRADDADGIAVFSLTRSGWREFELRVDLKGPGQSVPRAVMLYERSRARDWNGGAGAAAPVQDPEGRLVVLQLPPGAYRITHWWGESDSDGMNGDGYDIHGGDLAVEFTVRPAQVTYLGSLHLKLPERLNFQANLTPAFYHLDVEDRRERDLAVLKERFPDANLARIDEQPMRFAKAGQPLRYYVFNRKVGDPDRR